MCLRLRHVVLLLSPPWFKSLKFRDRLFVNDNLSEDEILEAIASWLKQHRTQDIPMKAKERNQ